MHLPDGYLANSVCLVTTGISATAVALSVRHILRSKSSPSLNAMPSMAAAVFAAQMINVPLPGLPVSGHLLGGLLCGAQLGRSVGFLAMALVITIQAVLFADGGLTTLGANVINMGLIGTILGGFLYQPQPQNFSFKRLLLFGLYGGLAVGLACAACLAEVACSFQLSPSEFAQFTNELCMLHLRIAGGEALIGMAAYTVSNVLVNDLRRASTIPQAPAFLLLAILLVLASPWASSAPDALETAASHTSLAALAVSSPLLLSDYQIPLFTPVFGTMLAGLLGIALVLALGIATINAKNLGNPVSRQTAP